MRLDYYALRDYVRTEVEGTGKSIKFINTGTVTTAYTDGNTIHVEAPVATWTEEQWDLWFYAVYHEIGHESPENCQPHWRTVAKANHYDKKPVLAWVANYLSDHAQEHNRVGKLLGRDDILKRGREKFVRGAINSGEYTNEREDASEYAAQALAAYDVVQRAEWNQYMPTLTWIADELRPEAKEYYDKLSVAGFDFTGLKNEQEVHDMAVEIMDVLDLKEPDDKQNQESKSKSQDGGEGEAEKFADKVAGLTAHVHYEKPKQYGEHKPSFKGMDIQYEFDKHTQHYEFNVARDPVIIDLKNKNYDESNINVDNVEYVSESIRDTGAGDSLSTKIKMYLVSQQQSRWEHGHKRGKISGKNLWKATRPMYSQEVFKKKVQRLQLNTAVTVLCDFSGSMSGSKFAHAARAGIMLNEALVKIGVPVELLGFSDGHAGNYSMIISPFNEINVNEDELIERYAIGSRWTGCNSDGESILWAYNRLRQHKAKRKVMFVLSDGSPASVGFAGDEVAFTKQVVRAIEEESPHDIYGIGIKNNNVESIYKHYSVIDNINDLEDKLLEAVTSKILGERT